MRFMVPLCEGVKRDPTTRPSKPSPVEVVLTFHPALMMLAGLGPILSKALINAASVREVPAHVMTMARTACESRQKLCRRKDRARDVLASKSGQKLMSDPLER
jgi:hypothetical protein